MTTSDAQRPPAEAAPPAALAERIVAEIAPGSALAVGPGAAALAEALRARGVEAEAGDLAAPARRRYVLAVALANPAELPPAQAEAAAAALSALADDVLIIPGAPGDGPASADDGPERWAARLARHGLFRDLDFDAALLAPSAARFRRRADPPHRIVGDYERHLRALARERAGLRELAREQRERILDAEARAAAAELRAGLAERAASAEAERAARELREGLAAPARELADLHAYAARLEAELAAKDAHIGRLEGLVRGLENGRVMRLLRALSKQRGRGGEIGARRQDVPPSPPPRRERSEGAPPLPGASAASDPAYARWIAANEPGPAELARQREAARAMDAAPLISALMPVFNPPVAALRAAIGSLRAQSYEHWELCVADGGSAPAVRAVLEEAAAADPRVRVALLGENRGIAGNANAALALARGELALILDHDDALAPDALFALAALLAERPDADAIYFDEDKITEDGATRHSPWFKPRAASPDLLLSTNYLMHGAFRTALLRELGGFDPATDGAQDWDMALRIAERTGKIHHIPRVLYHWRQVPGSAAREATAKPWAIAGQRRALDGHLARIGAAGAHAEVSEQGLARVIWPTFGLKVSIIIPTKDKADLLRACVGSILRGTAYPSYEIVLVDTGSAEPATASYYAELAAEPRVKLVRLPGPFNWGRANNVGARHATGDRLLFLNNDTEALEPGWLDELVGWAERPEVGVVGARLVRPDGSTQHAGMAIGVEGHGSHLFDGTSGPIYGPFGSSEWYRDMLAVTGACVLVRREVFAELGGFDEGYSVGYSDMTFCLDAVARGYRVVYTPFARLLHHEGASRGLHLPPADVLRATMRMLPLITAGDPFYSRNLSPVSRVPAVADPAGEDALERLATILRLFGLVYYDGSAPLRELAATWAPAPPARERAPGEPPSILVITHDLGLSGAPIILGGLAAALAARGYAVTVAAPADGPLRARLEPAGVTVRVVDHVIGDATVSFGAIAGHDVALVNTIHGARAVHAARAAGVPCVWWIHESEFGRRLADQRPEVAAAFAAADALVFPAAATAARYAELLPGPAPAPIPYGVRAVPLPRDARAPTDGRVRAVLLGSVEPRKGQDVALRALAALPEELRGAVEVQLMGGMIDWPYAGRVAEVAAATPGARLLGALPHEEALARLAEAEVFILASRDEVLPVALLEAMAAGKAIVASAVGGVPEALRDGEEALLFPAEDHAALAGHLARLAREPGLAARLGAAARARWERDFTVERFVEHMEGVIRGALRR